jgi:hypothetical protein
MNNHTYIETSGSSSKNKPLGYKWIFKRNMKVDGTIERYKATLVKSFKQQEGVDDFDIYSHVSRITFI